MFANKALAAVVSVNHFHHLLDVTPIFFFFLNMNTFTLIMLFETAFKFGMICGYY